MKKLKLLMAGIAALGLLTACSDDDSSSTNGNTTEVVNTVQDGTWRITSFVEETNDETHHFTGYNFTFDDNDVLTATNGANTYTGTWSVTNSSNSSDDDDNNNSDIDFNIMFASPDNFTDLNDDWDILERTDTKIRLRDISGGNGGTDYLTFEKN